MDFGDPEPPTLYSGDVLRKARQEYRDEELGYINKEDVFRSLEHMKNSEPYAGWIQLIAMNSVMIHYSMPSQYEIYKSYVKNKYSKISIDATGSVIQKITREIGLSAHLFLYEVVINTGKNQLPVTQMVSERQDTNAILFWLLEWRRNEAPIPNEIVCDGSTALLNAAVRGLAECRDLKQYQNICFRIALGMSEELPLTFLRMDVAHFIKSICRWEDWKRIKLVKDFLMRSFVVLLQSTSLERFRYILKEILILTFTKYYGHFNGKPTPAEKSRNILAEEIGKISG